MSRVLLFGLDGATFTVLDDLVRRGVMPHLGELMASGARGVLMSTTPPLTPVAWSTMITGRSPGHHGITGFFQHDSPHSAALRIVSARQLRAETLWSIVNRAGRRAGSLNFVAHHPAPPIDGYVVPGWVPWKWIRRFSHPPDLIPRLEATLPELDLKKLAMDFEQERKCLSGAQLDDYESWIGLHIERDHQWFEILKEQLANDPTELAGIVFDGVDKLQHLLWDQLDPARAAAAAEEQVRMLCWRYFQQIDQFLADIRDRCGDDCTLLIVSDHGFTGTEQILHINTWLEREGYLTWKAGTEWVDDARDLEPEFYRLAAFDLATTRAFALTASSNGIHIAVRGRRGEAGIAPEEYEAFRETLTHALLTRCVDPDTGRPLVARVWRREEIFAGPQMELAPDLTLTLHDHGFFSVRRSRAILTTRPRVVGTHHPEGVFIAHGAPIRRGLTLPALQIVDIAPTILHVLGVPIPAELDGRVIEEMFVEDRSPTIATASRAAPAADVPAPDRDADPEGTLELLERMKALGYIE